MTQYVINIGALPNDGTGDPLRTAFNEVNLNFDQVFAAGPVLSNVQISNNTILTTNTNGNLVLAPNGVGVVQSNVSIVPNTSNIRNLGSADRRWSTLYIQYANISGSITVSDLTATGNVTVGGNLSVTGNIINVANIITDAKTIQLANTAGTANAANGSGITVGANDAIATFLFNSANNVWNTNIGLGVGGPITGTSLAVSDATIYGNLNGIDANFTGTVTSPSLVVNNISSDDSTFVTIADGLNVQGDITASTLSVTGNIQGNYFLGNAAFMTGLPTPYANANAVAYGQAGWAGNIVPASSNTYSLGNATNWWSNIWVAGNTIYIGGVPVGMSAGNVLTVNGNAVLQNDSNTTISTTGNITADYFFGNNSQLGSITMTDTPVGPSNLIQYGLGNIVVWNDGGWTIGEYNGTDYGTEGIRINPGIEGPADIILPADAANVPVQVNNYVGGVIVNAGNGAVQVSASANSWIFNPDASVQFPQINVPRGDNPSGNINGYTLVIGDGENEAIITTPNGSESIPNSQRLVINPGKGADLTSGEGGDIYLWAGRGGSGDAANAVSAGSGGDVKIRGGQGGGGIDAVGDGGYIRIEGGDSSALGGQAGFIEITGGRSQDQTGGFVRITGGQGVAGGDANILGATGTAGPGGNVNIGGGASANGLAEYGNVNISAGAGTWKFDNTGNLITPGNTVIGPTPGGGGSILQPDASLQIVGEGANAFVVSGWAANTNAPDSIAVVAYNAPYGNGASNVQIAVGNNATTVNYWNFGTDGNLTLPISGNIVGTTANNSGSLQWIGNSSGDGYGYTTMILRPDDTGGSDQAIVIDPTAPNHIHIRAGGTQDNSAASLFLGGENSAFQVPAGQNPPLYVIANNNSWTFGTDSVLLAPGDISTAGNVTAGYFIGDGSQLTGLPAQYGDANVATFLANYGSNTVSTTGNITAGNFIGSGSNVDIVAGSYTWTFDNGGALAAPGQINATSISLSGTGTAVNASSGNILTNRVTGTQFAFLNGIYTAVLTGSGATANYTLNLPANVGSNGQSLTSDGTGNLVWTTPASSYGNANVATFLASYGSNTISTTGNITAGNLIGNISITGNVTGTSANVDIVAGVYQWTFNNAGNLVLPGNTFAVNYANGTAVSLGGAGSYGNANVADFLAAFGSNTVSTTGNVTSGNTLTSGYVSATGFVYGSELTSTLSSGSEGGQINLSVPAANTTLGGSFVTVDVYENRLRFFEGSANARGAYIDLANCAAGPGTNLVNRASIIAGANTAVTLDNLQARVGGSPTRLYINTVSGNLTGAGQSQTLLSGSTAVSSWINVPIGQGAGNAFAMSGALTSNGDTAILSLIDQGSGTGMWRITGMIANTTANLYGVTIERLV